MLKHSMFSDFYITRRNRLAGARRSMPLCEGSLAVSPQYQPGQRLVISRVAPRTWWETGWQLQR